ncbi:unnamed protein product [Chironomus riparius]|uniref:Uncharacterized protein n=1 Tax=Chironomus riparius TaxID=315576 RepID=A0A9N9RUP1_9DIPT|nr:unnamed protein product [Chironomus riparius]
MTNLCDNKFSFIWILISSTQAQQKSSISLHFKYRKRIIKEDGREKINKKAVLLLR